MTEAEWLVYAYPKPMLDVVRTDGRKLVLWAVGCCRRDHFIMQDRRSRLAVESAEGHADGRGTRDDGPPSDEDCYLMSAAANQCMAAGFQHAGGLSAEAVKEAVREAVETLIDACDAEPAAEASAQAGMLRDIFGNPFRPVTFDPAWLTPAVTSLAQMSYEERTFDRMPELADALEQLGCTNADILEHCRGPGPHVRGCWVVDLVLGKS